jgi:hypothetical protein
MLHIYFKIYAYGGNNIHGKVGPIRGTKKLPKYMAYPIQYSRPSRIRIEAIYLTSKNVMIVVNLYYT